MTISSANQQVFPLDVVYRVHVHDKETGKKGYHNKTRTYRLEKLISKATVYTSYQSAKSVYGYHYKNKQDRYDVQILTYILTPFGVENLPAGT